MKTENLLKISLIISVSGILLLLLLANILEPKLIDISEINSKMLNQKVKVSGFIFKIEDKETFQILSIADETEKIDVLCECKEELEKNQEIIVIGKVQEYQQSLQIQAEKIMRE